MERILFDQEKEFDILEIKGLMEKYKFKWVYFPRRPSLNNRRS